MTKFRLYLNKDKETTWINEMAAKGYALKSFFAGFYSFEKCEPGEYVYQIDFGSKMYSVSDDYREFMEENNIEIVCLWGYWIFLRKRADEREFVLYTDVDSSIEHYTKILKMFKVVTIIELICFLAETLAAINGAAVGIFGMLIIGVLIIALMHATLSTKRTINELKERKGEAIVKNQAATDEKSDTNNIIPGQVSPILLAGLTLNLIANSMRNSGTISEWIVIVIQVLAILFMLVGIYKSREVFKK